MKKAVYLLSLVVALVVAWLLWSGDRGSVRSNRVSSLPPGDSSRREQGNESAPQAETNKSAEEGPLWVRLHNRERIVGPAIVAVAEIQDFSDVHPLESVRLPTGRSEVRFPLPTLSRDGNGHLLLITVRDALGNPRCAQRVFFPKTASIVISIELATTVSVYIDKGEKSADLSVTYSSGAETKGDGRFKWSRRSRVSERETHVIGSFPPGIIIPHVVDTGFALHSTIRLAGEQRHIDLITPRMSSLIVQLKGGHKGSLQLRLSSRSKSRMLAAASGRPTEESLGEIHGKTVRTGQNIAMEGLGGDTYRVTVLDWENSTPRVLWQREDVHPVSGTLHVDLDRPEGRVAEGQVVEFAAWEGQRLEHCSGTILWQVTIDGCVVEGSAPWAARFTLPPVRGAAEVVFIPDAQTSERYAAERWIFWTNGGEKHPQRVVLSRAHRRHLRVDVARPLRALLIMNKDQRALRIDLEVFPHLVIERDGIVLLGVPASTCCVLIGRKSVIASETVTRVVRNPLAIPRAIVFQSRGAEWRSPKPIVIPPRGKIEVELPAAGRAVQILERVPRLRDGRVSMSDLAIGEPIDVSARRGEIVLR